jgi:predicted small secreted protein
MKKNKIKTLCLGFLLSLSTSLSPCITSYGLGGDVELCIEDNEHETPYFLYDESDENSPWMELFHEGEDYEA